MPLFLFLLQELRHVLGVFAPFVDEGLHVVRKRRVETDHLPGARMDKAQRLGMKGLTRQELEAVLYEATIFRVDRTLAYLGSIVPLVVEERMAYPVEMDSDLMGSSGLEAAFHYGHVAEALEDTVVRHRVLSMVAVREDLEAHAVVRVTADVADDGAFVFLDVTPYDCNVAALDRMYEELLGQMKLSLFVLRHH